jgi:hypothetical protein
LQPARCGFFPTDRHAPTDSGFFIENIDAANRPGFEKRFKSTYISGMITITSPGALRRETRSHTGKDIL